MASDRLGSLRGPAVIAVGLAFAAWTWVTITDRLPSWIDAGSRHRHLTEGGAMAQIQQTLAMVSHPVVITVAVCGLAWWAWQRRLRNIAWAIVIGLLIAWPLGFVLTEIIRRPRPANHLPWSLTTSGWSYPSMHVSVITAAALLTIATTTTTRQPHQVVFAWRVIGTGAIALVVWNQWIINAHRVSDIVGGFLLGSFAAASGLVLTGVHMLPGLTTGRSDAGHRRICAVIHNPTKVTDMSSFRRHVEWEVQQRGWYDTLWLQTTRDDPGVEMAEQAIKAGVDLVIVAGGDGTVRVVCSGLAHSGIPVAIVAAGTGNLLARNLGIPLDETSALDVAFDGVTEEIDMVKVTVDDEPIGHFVVMAGVGVDARIMSTTNPELKKAVGSAAYFIAAAQQLATPPVDLTYRIDEHPPVEQQAALAVVGNVGVLQANIVLFPKARPNDGLLDVLIGAPGRPRDWAVMVRRVLMRRGAADPHITEESGRQVSIKLAEPTPYELDGDAEGRVTQFDAEVDAASLRIQLPRPLRHPPSRERS